MPTLLYSPGIKVVIETTRGTLDVSPDLERGRLTLTEDAVSHFSFALTNHRRKYDGVFTPNDRISVQMKRIRWVQVFSGYMNAVPYFSVYPRSVPLSASCSLKRLLYTLWDAGTVEAFNLLHEDSPLDDDTYDQGLAGKIIRLMTEPQLGGWPNENIHIGRIPSTWFEKVRPLYESLKETFTVDEGVLSPSGVIGGSGSLGGLTNRHQETGPGYGVLPATRGKCSFYGVEATGGFPLSPGENTRNLKDQWYCAMRFPYVKSTLSKSQPHVSYLTSAQMNKAMSWWRGPQNSGRKLVVLNPKTNQAVVVRGTDWGPAEWTGRVIDLSPTALRAIGAKTDDEVEIRFAPDNAPTGPWNGATTGGTTPTSTTPGTGDVGELAFATSENLAPHVAACKQFVDRNWEAVKGYSGYRRGATTSSGRVSDHASGHALDILVSQNHAAGDELTLGNTIAMWFAQNPNAFGVTQIIWHDRINTGSGWRPFSGGDSSANQRHTNHVHLSFQRQPLIQLGPMGSPWPGSNPTDFGNNVGSLGGMPSGGGSAITNISWGGSPDPISNILSGPRALMNDDPLLDTVADLVHASMRKFMSAPNGDFIAWFPDYFGTYNIAAKMRIEPIELAGDGFTIMWSDERLITHQYTAGSTAGHADTFSGAAVDVYQQFRTHGIASVDFPEIMQALFNVSPNDPRAKTWLDKDAIYQRFGARKSFIPLGQIYGERAEFWSAMFYFQKNWAEQFSSSVELTFMPELYPGMLLELPAYKFQAYIEQVSHSFDFSEGGTGFTTDVRITAPSATNGSGLFALPRGD